MHEEDQLKRPPLPPHVQAEIAEGMARAKKKAKLGPLKANWGDGPYPPWVDNSPAMQARWRAEIDRREQEHAFTPLQQTRAKLKVLTAVVRSNAFDDWRRACVVKADAPGEWTQARTLYESYLQHARKYGSNREQRAEAVLAQATETTWGRMMASVHPKVRRGSGWHYPVRLKKGA